MGNSAESVSIAALLYSKRKIPLNALNSPKGLIPKRLRVDLKMSLFWSKSFNVTRNASYSLLSEVIPSALEISFNFSIAGVCSFNKARIASEIESIGTVCFIVFFDIVFSVISLIIFLGFHPLMHMLL